jgi:hypothetical protein
MTRPARSRRAFGGIIVTAIAQQTEHLNERPDWDCRLCGRPWPCANAKTDLLTEFRAFPSVLRIYMSTQMYEALTDLTSHGEPAPADLYERFLSWANTQGWAQPPWLGPPTPGRG